MKVFIEKYTPSRNYTIIPSEKQWYKSWNKNKLIFPILTSLA